MMVTQAPRLPGSVTGRTCPVREKGHPCARTVRPGHLMCPGHWRQVPTSLRTAVWGAWRAFQRSSADADWTQYMHMRDKALEHFDADPDVESPPPSEAVTLADLDDASVVLVVAPDGSSKMWWGERDEAVSVLRRVADQIESDGQ